MYGGYPFHYLFRKVAYFTIWGLADGFTCSSHFHHLFRKVAYFTSAGRIAFAPHPAEISPGRRPMEEGSQKGITAITRLGRSPTSPPRVVSPLRRLLPSLPPRSIRSGGSAVGRPLVSRLEKGDLALCSASGGVRTSQIPSPFLFSSMWASMFSAASAGSLSRCNCPPVRSRHPEVRSSTSRGAPVTVGTGFT